mmetsp:Transcript_36804/g.112881  ORF Transcript_36804/g.112881 Transcript_36804/m.112881 type:complete len:109 (-) Transcript_36804:449-775(-)
MPEGKGKHVDHFYISPGGRRFDSRVKVLRHLGLAVDPNPAVAARAGGSRISDAERARRAAAAEERRQPRPVRRPPRPAAASWPPGAAGRAARGRTCSLPARRLAAGSG